MQTTVSETGSEERIKETFKKQLLLTAVFKNEEVGKMYLVNTSDEELQNKVKDRVLGTMQSNGENRAQARAMLRSSHLRG